MPDEDGPSLVSPTTFKSLFRQHPAGVAVVTLTHEGTRYGFTATSVISVSADPPILTFSIDSSSSSWPALAEMSAAQVTGSLSGRAPEAGEQWSSYADVHKQIRGLDDAGKWDQAVRLATGTGAGSANATFGGFDEQSSVYLDGVTQDTEQGLVGSRVGLIIGAVLSLLAGLAAAVLALRGVEARLREYR